MSDKPVSENLFERFCTENSIKWCRIDRSNVKSVKTADDSLCISGRRIVVEVTQLDPNPDDKRNYSLLQEGGMTEVRKDRTTSRIRNKIRRKMCQLKSSARHNDPTLLVLYSNLPLHGRYIDPKHILMAMYGKETVHIALHYKE